ncbi:hypothetical protein M8C21_006772 [Ambrosia artemisiifolia]|uniref:Uncharacterized protein n=1 Tax=Ambrosia artemisiifolia TaxID=4212 RepID=A0AAD5CI26_AMBAR|nr:hypothetical protein M8C21_006772 [Ambrosia artemisiifolia]
MWFIEISNVLIYWLVQVDA